MDFMFWPSNDPRLSIASPTERVVANPAWVSLAFLSLQVLASILFIIAFFTQILLQKKIKFPGPSWSFSTAMLVISNIILTGCLVSKICYEITHPTSTTTRRHIIDMVAACFAVLGCISSIIHWYFGGRATLRMLYAATMMLANVTIMFQSQLWQYEATLVLLYAIDWSADHAISTVVHGEDVCPLESAPIFSRLDFSWLNSLIVLAQERALDEDDLSPLPKSMSPETTSSKLQRKSTTKSLILPSFWTLIFSNFFTEICFSFLLELADILSKFLMPWLFKTFLDTQRSYLIAAMFVLNVANSVVKSQATYNGKVAGAKFKAGIVSGIGEKALRLSSESWSTGVSVINLVEVDTQRVQDFIMFINAAWSAPLQLTLCLTSIEILLGWKSALGAILSIVLAFPLFVMISNKMQHWQGKAMSKKDSRIKIISEIMYRIKTVKLYGQQKSAEEKFHKARAEELRTMTPMAWLVAIMNVLMRSAPTSASVAAFGIAQATSERLDANNTFPALLMFGLLVTPLATIPMVASSWTGCMVSYNRIQSFFLLGEKETRGRNQVLPRSRDASIIMKDVSYQWHGQQTRSDILKNVTLRVKPGQLIGITGPIGSGKSTTLSLLANLLPPSKGSISVPGNLAYMPQSAWLMSGTIRENIIFGKQYDPELYDEVIRACELKRDLDLLLDGDLTKVGSIGVALSGGQKSRISLARAVYSGAEVQILDDPLAAVDNRVHQAILEQVLGPNRLLKTSTRIITTNSLSLIAIVDTLYTIESRRLVEIPKPQLEANNKPSIILYTKEVTIN